MKGSEQPSCQLRNSQQYFKWTVARDLGAEAHVVKVTKGTPTITAGLQTTPDTRSQTTSRPRPPIL